MHSHSSTSSSTSIQLALLEAPRWLFSSTISNLRQQAVSMGSGECSCLSFSHCSFSRNISLLSLFLEQDLRMITGSLRAWNLMWQNVQGYTMDLNLGMQNFLLVRTRPFSPKQIRILQRATSQFSCSNWEMLTQKVLDISSSSSITNLLQARGRTAPGILSQQSSTHISENKQFMNQLEKRKSFTKTVPIALSQIMPHLTLPMTIVDDFLSNASSCVIEKVKQIMSLELILFPKENREKVYKKFSLQGKGELPVVLFFHKEKKWRHFKQYMLVAIDPQSTIFQLIQMLQVKLTWRGYLTDENKTLFLNVGQTQITTSMDKKVKFLYDTYKQQDGWLELSLSTLSAFG